MAATRGGTLMWVKVCGTTSLEDAQVAVEAGADALGFVFASSPRRVTPAQAAAITAHIAAPVLCVGVFVDSTLEEVIATVEQAGLGGVQLHSSSDATLAGRLRAHFGDNVQILRVLHYAPEMLAEQLATFDPAVDAILIDSRTAQAVGGTGVRFDWQAARALLQSAHPGMRIVVAGGLNPENVQEAIATLAPAGVDVVTGVETAPGRKDAAKVRAFVQNARR